MATAYAAIVSLMNVLTRIQNPGCSVPLEKLAIHSLFDTSTFFLGFLERFSRTESDEMEGFMLRITNAAYVVEDHVESYIAEQILAESDCEKDKSLLREAINELDVIREEVMAIKEKKYDGYPLTKSPVYVGFSSHSSGKVTTVGLEDDLVCLMDQLTTHECSLRTIPIVGMGGIGKTTLARTVYEHPYVTNHFHICAWVTISQDYSLEGVIRDLLRDICIHVNENKNLSELREQLHKVMSGRKYLVVLDDIWTTMALDEIRRLFPKNDNGSRILLTTRLLKVALSIGSSSPYKMDLLDNDKSWNILSQRVFGLEGCPSELEDLGKQISTSCKGLPLTLVVIGGLLKMSEKTREYWKDVAGNIKFIINKEKDCFSILSLSYTHLPVHLKPCFLYMGTFREGYDIRVSALVRLWVSEGFLRPTSYKTLEEIAIEYLNDLTDRNLIMVGKRGSGGKMKSCVLHDLLRDLCLREAERERFFCVIEDDTSNIMQRIGNQRRLFMNGNQATMRKDVVIPLPLSVRSLVTKLWCSPWSTSGFSLLRVLHTLDPYNEPVNILRLVNLRYLALSAKCYLQSEYFPSICMLRNLETLVLSGSQFGQEVILPSEIWELRYLRHLIFTERVTLADPVGSLTDLLLENLQTLSTVVNFIWDAEVLSIIPSLKKMKVHYDMNMVSDTTVSCCFNNLVRLNRLETLVCSFTPKWKLGVEHECVFNDLETLKWSRSLKKLTLRGCNVPWEHITVFGSLPNLEVLKLEHNSFFGKEWNSIEGEFQRLKFLSISSCSLSTWKAEGLHFPRLECLALRHINLEEIPFGIGDITTLKSIVLCYVPTTAIISAKEILEEQQRQGIEDLLIDVRIHPHQKKELQLMSDESNSRFRVFSTDIKSKVSFVRPPFRIHSAHRTNQPWLCQTTTICFTYPPPELEKKKHKLKHLFQPPYSFMDVKCQGCFNITTVFSHSQTIVMCRNCQIVLCQPAGGKARLTEGCSFRKKGD